MLTDDIIAAIATASGAAGIGIVRLSGAGAGDLAGALVRARPDGPPTGRGWLTSHRLRHAYLVDPADGQVIDEVMVVRMAAPRSYTREEVVEFHTHGGVIATRAVLATTLRRGARLAEPGEFTLRAFLNGRVDLAQAEAVAQIIDARTPRVLAMAVAMTGDRFRQALTPARDAVVRALAWLEASVDFPDDDIPPAAPIDDLVIAEAALADVVGRAEAGAVYRDGVTVVLAGRPNVGKSSLMNALLRYERAIVTPIAGTTRDTIAESLVVDGVAVTLTDTAGLTTTDEPVERLGVARTRQALAAAGVTVLVLDASAPLRDEDRTVIEEVGAATAFGPIDRDERRASSSGPIIVALNKCDRPTVLMERDVRALLTPFALVHTSAVTGAGLPDLEAAIAAIIQQQTAHAQADPALLTVRQSAALATALTHVRASQAALTRGLPTDIVAVDVRAAWSYIGEVTGELVTEALLHDIFSRFCIGK